MALRLPSLPAERPGATTRPADTTALKSNRTRSIVSEAKLVPPQVEIIAGKEDWSSIDLSDLPLRFAVSHTVHSLI
jgi:hypothetical protein